ncbi:MAG: YabP/YqfC family sporulation protein [Clostridia bacterium]|nr:YabP/YqfC family sporulation protein [Clostridia bacterium]
MGQKGDKKRRESSGGGFFMEVEGNRRVILSGCCGIQAYAEDCICLRTPFGAVTVYGEQLEMGCMTVDGATVIGRLQRIEFS